MLEKITKEYFEKEVKKFLDLSILNKYANREYFIECLEEDIEILQGILFQYTETYKKCKSKFFQVRIDSCNESIIYLKKIIKMVKNRVV